MSSFLSGPWLGSRLEQGLGGAPLNTCCMLGMAEVHLRPPGQGKGRIPFLGAAGHRTSWCSLPWTGRAAGCRALHTTHRSRLPLCPRRGRGYCPATPPKGLCAHLERRELTWLAAHMTPCRHQPQPLGPALRPALLAPTDACSGPQGQWVQETH